MRDLAYQNKTLLFQTFSLKSLHRNMAMLVFCLSVIFGAPQVKATDYTVTDNGDSGANTLRAAIIAANTHAGLDRILFNLSAGNRTITPLTPLPIITDSVTVDGRPGGTTVAAPIIELNGAMSDNAFGPTKINDNYGLQISAGNCTIRGLIINRFRNAGIKITGSNTRLLQNIIGTDAAGTPDLGNFNQGVLFVASTGNTIGGADPLERNIISGNQGSGITLTRNSSATVINNYIGVDGNGTADLGNTNDGILIADSSNSVIGGISNTERNIISGNNGNGVYIAQNTNSTQASGNIIRGNYIGVDASGAGISAGNSIVGNNGSGVVIEAGGNLLGGTSANARNIISGNRANGVSLGTNFATANVVAANYIGVAADGTTQISNRLNGVQITNLAFGNTIGGANVSIGACDNSCNLIANNGDPVPTRANSGRAAIYLDSSAGNGNTIRRNSIFSNAELGIDLAVPSSSTDTAFVPGTGANTNDAGDGDTGPNNLQNSPVVSAANTNGEITGTLDSVPNTTFAIDLYRNDAAGDEAQIYIGSAIVRTGGTGSAAFGYATPAVLTASQTVTATATTLSSPIGDTSEISAARAVIQATTAAAAGFEADVFTRPSGDSFLDSNDVAQVESFSLGNEQVSTPNEFQRADCFPYNTRGDGFIDANDVAQAENYALGLESRQAAGGPTQAGGRGQNSSDSTGEMSRNKALENDAAAIARVVRVVPTNTSAGQQVTVPINVDANGDESIYGFSLNYDTTKLTLVSITPGTSNGIVGTNTMTAGQIGFSVSFTSRPTKTIGAGTNQNLVNVTFNVAVNAPAGQTTLTFGDTPARRSVSNSGPPVTDLTPGTTFTDGNVTISAPTAAPASISGEITTGRGLGIAGVSVSLLDLARGEKYYTTTNRSGMYRFDGLTVGENYIVTPETLDYSINPTNKVISLTEDSTNVDFTATHGKKARNF